MSGFNVGANAFLSSALKEKLLCPNPTTERGVGLHVNAHPTLPLIIYPSGKFIVVRDMTNPGNSFVYRGHASTTTVAKFSPNGYWVASGDSSGKLRVWSWDNPEHLTKMETQAFSGRIGDLDWDCESKKLAVGGEGSGILVKCLTWDTGNTAGEMVGHNKRVLSVAYKPSRPFRIITASEDFKTVFYAGPPFKLDHSMAAHSNFANCVRYSADGSRAVSVGSDKKIQLYDGKTGEMTLDLPNAHAGGIYSVSFSPDGAHFITASADKTVKLWCSESGQLQETFTIAQVPGDPQVGDAQVSCLWTSFCMLSVSLNGNINLLVRGSESPESVIQAQQTPISALAVHPASQRVYSGSTDGVVCMRDLAGAAEGVRLGGDKKHLSGGAHGGKVVGLACVEGGVVSVGWDDKMRFCVGGAYSTEAALEGQPVCLASSATLLCVVTNAEVALYRGAEKVGSISVQQLGFTPTVAALLDETEVAIGGADFKTHIFSLDNMQFSAGAVIETRSAVSALAYSPAGDALAIGDAGRQVEVYERGSWAARIRGKWVFHTSTITCLAWAADGSALASGSLDENIYVWSCANPSQKLQIPFTHTGGVSGVAWLAPGKLVSSGSDGCVVSWNVPPFE